VAVFTQVSKAGLAAFLQHYEAGKLLSFKGVDEGVENSVYSVVTTEGRFALTLYEGRTPSNAVPFILGFVEHLANSGMEVPVVLRSGSGQLFGELANRPASLVRWLPGSPVQKALPGLAFRAGASLASLHLAGSRYRPSFANAFRPTRLQSLLERCRSAARAADLEVLDHLERELEYARETWRVDLPEGPIHGDFFPDNVLVRDGKISGIIDFGFACTDAYAYDLAIAHSAWGFASTAVPLPTSMAALVQGYQSRRPLSAAELAAFNGLCRGAALRFTLTRMHDLLFHDCSWRVRPKDPMTYWRRLEFYRSHPNLPMDMASCFM
jgi:homoserine kinase type II